MKRRIFARGHVVAFATVVALLVAGRAHASPLGLVTSTPDITAFFLDFAFDSSGNACGAGADYTLCFSADPSAISSYGLPAEITDFVPYQLVAAVDPLTGMLTMAGGLFSMGGYLAGNVIAFGYEIAGGVANFEFLVDITGGSLASSFGPTLGVVGSIFDWGAVGFGTELTTVTSADAFTDNFAPIPEPASIGLLGVGLFTLAARIARRKRA